MIHSDELNNKENNINQNTAGTFGNQPQGQAQIDIVQKVSLGFLQNDMKLMSSNKAADFATAIYKGIVNVYSTSEDAKQLNVTLLDKNVTAGLAYSYIVVSRLVDKTISYFVIILEATGREPMTAEEIIAEYNSVIKTKQSSRNLYTTGEAINTYLREMIVERLQGVYKDSEKYSFVSADALTIPFVLDDVDLISPIAGSIAYNALSVLNASKDPSRTDLNIAIGNRETGNAVLETSSSIGRTTSTDELGNPIRSDFKLELGVRQNTNTGNVNYAEELNKVNSNTVLTKVCGFVEAYPEELQMPLPNGAIARQTRLHPQIVLTYIGAAKPTIGFMLFGLVSSLIMTNKDMWLANLLPDGSKYNVGVLNAITDIEGNGSYEVLDLDASAGKGKEKKYNADKIYSLVNEMFKLSPIISVDVPDYGPNTFYMSVLSAAASGVNNANTQGALKTIIETAHVLTNGNFPLNYNPAEIFLHEGVLVPLGSWREPKTGAVRDIRDIDLTMVMSETADMEVARRWVASGVPARLSNLDPYLTKVDIISLITPKAKITGRGVRVTFTTKFINELSTAVAAAGLTVRYESEVKLLEQNNFNFTNGLISNAVLNNVAGFARPNVVAGPGLRMNYSNVGFGRFGF